MAKYNFSDAERFAVYVVHGERCYLCHKPLDYMTAEVDHVIPERLLDDPRELAEALAALGRPPTFKINSFANWMPACGSCNRNKLDTVYQPSLLIQNALQTAERKAPQAAKLAAETVNNRRVSKAVVTLRRACDDKVQSGLVIAQVRALIEHHLLHRPPERAADPIRLAPDYAVALEIRFTGGGCLGGRTLTSGSVELDSSKTRWLLLLVGSFLAKLTRARKQPTKLLVWKQPVPEIAKLANEAGWSEEQRNAWMRYHVYHVNDYEDCNCEGGSVVRFKAAFQKSESWICEGYPSVQSANT